MRKSILSIGVLINLVFTHCSTAVDTHQEKAITGKLQFEIVDIKVEDTVRSTCSKNYLLWLTIKNTTREKVYFYNPAIIPQREINGKYQEDYQWMDEGHFYSSHCTFPFTDEVRQLRSKSAVYSTQSPAFALVKSLLTEQVLAKLDEHEKFRAGFAASTFIFLQPGEEAKQVISMPALNAAKGNFRFFALGVPQVEWSAFDASADVIKKIGPMPKQFRGYRYWQGKVLSDTLFLKFNQFNWKRRE